MPDDNPLTPYGLTLRDYFAGQALAGLLANPRSQDVSFPEAAADAWDFADAMLAARNGPPVDRETNKD